MLINYTLADLLRILNSSLVEIIERLKSLKPEKIIFFGSYAFGNPHKDSDIDILVVSNNEFIPSNYNEKMQVYLKVAKLLEEFQKKFPIDLIVYTKPMYQKFITLDSHFSNEIISKGQVIYEKN